MKPANFVTIFLWSLVCCLLYMQHHLTFIESLILSGAGGFAYGALIAAFQGPKQNP